MKNICPLLLFVIAAFVCSAQQPIIIKATSPKASFYVDAEYYKDAWTISPQIKPDVQTIPVRGKPVSVSFVTDQDSLHFLVQGGKAYNFIVVLNGKDSAYTQIKGDLFTNPVTFTKQYIATHNNKTFVEVPEVYELVNILYAITPSGKTDPYIVFKKSDYYKEVMAHFEKYNAEPAVLIMDSLLKDERYANVKMDAYTFSFNKQNKIIKSNVYDRASWGTNNTLQPYIRLLESFAATTGFRTFFAAHKPLYNQQIAGYRDSLNTGRMQVWLNKNFPDTRYNSIKIIFTPLVAYNQSAHWFESNGFKEAHAHVNFPYLLDFAGVRLSEKAIQVMRGNIVFTEINHAFANLEAEKPKYAENLKKAFADLDKWIDKTKPAKNYLNVYACFEEYMNWVLVSLRYVDEAPADELNTLIEKNELNITNGRGFKKFTAFNKFVVALYKARKPGETVADLYPQIIDWCGKQ